MPRPRVSGAFVAFTLSSSLTFPFPFPSDVHQTERRVWASFAGFRDGFSAAELLTGSPPYWLIGSEWIHLSAPGTGTAIIPSQYR